MISAFQSCSAAEYKDSERWDRRGNPSAAYNSSSTAPEATAVSVASTLEGITATAELPGVTGVPPGGGGARGGEGGCNGWVCGDVWFVLGRHQQKSHIVAGRLPTINMFSSLALTAPAPPCGMGVPLVWVGGRTRKEGGGGMLL